MNCEKRIEYEGTAYLLLDLPKSYFEEKQENGSQKLVDRYFTIYHQASSWKRAEKVVVRMRRREDKQGK
jgi:hypothetical protein